MSLSAYKRLSLLLLIVLLPLIAWLSYSLAYHYLQQSTLQNMHNQLDLFSSELETSIEKFAFLPRVLARKQKLKQLLSQPGTSPNLAGDINRDLAYINGVSNTDVIYLMRLDGTTIAASNWEANDSFTGGNFGFRPYFKNAIEGRNDRYFALGTTSKQRGYYFSSPVYSRSNEQAIGVIVVKVNIEKLENAWQKHTTTFLVTDLNGVVFSSNQADWQFTTLKPLSKTTIERIKQDQQYPLDILKQVKLTPDPNHTGLVSIDRAGGNHRYLQTRQDIPSLNWNIYALKSSSSLNKAAFSYSALASLLTFLSLALVHLAILRRYNLREKFEIKRQSEQQLMEAHNKLEQRVVNRTRDLSETNRILEQEISERRRAEHNLQKSQKELIHAAKLATLGQLASGISHELNQPLAAISNYAENALQFLKMNRLEQADQNLGQILKLAERMSNITAHLKTFSHKTDDHKGPTDVNQCIHHALTLMKPRLRASATRISLELVDRAEVLANPIRLEQVFINLFSNALDAMENADEKEIIVRQTSTESTIVITIIDTGSGIDPDRLPHIFDAFYTTKSVGVGLGLGLSISSEIIQSLGGELRATNQENRGARFEVELNKRK